MTDVLLTAGMLADRLRPLVLAACDGDEPERYGSSCLKGTPMIPLHRATVGAIYQHLERLAKTDGEKTIGQEAAAMSELERRQRGWPYG